MQKTFSYNSSSSIILTAVYSAIRAQMSLNLDILYFTQVLSCVQGQTRTKYFSHFRAVCFPFVCIISTFVFRAKINAPIYAIQFSFCPLSKDICVRYFDEWPSEFFPVPLSYHSIRLLTKKSPELYSGDFYTFIYLPLSVQQNAGSLAATAAQRGHRPFSSALVLCFQQRGHLVPAASLTDTASSPPTVTST